MRFVLIFALVTSSAFAQSPLQQKIRAIAVDAHGKVSVACSLPGSNLDCDLNAHAHPPMQSVFKFPLALTVLHQIEQGKFSLDQPIRFLPSDRILPHTHSPLQDKYPQAGVDVPLRELLRLAVSLSDNAAADILLRTVGGPTAVDDYMHSLGITGFHLQDGEDGLHRDVSAQYRNWFEPVSAVRLLRRISDHSPLTPENTQTLLNWMKATSTGPSRIRGELPEGTVVMDKTGSSGTDNGLTHATNDIGLVTLPDGRRLAIAVFVTDSTGGEKACDAAIARIAKAAYDAGVATTH